VTVSLSCQRRTRILFAFVSLGIRIAGDWYRGTVSRSNQQVMGTVLGYELTAPWHQLKGWRAVTCPILS